MGFTDLIYPTLVYVHLLLFVLWLGADVGVFVLGQHFRKRTVYTLDQRIALLKLLVIVDLTPRTAWALMVPLSLTVSYMGGWWELPVAIVWVTWAIAAFWLWLVFDAHTQGRRHTSSRRDGLTHGFEPDEVLPFLRPGEMRTYAMAYRGCVRIITRQYGEPETFVDWRAGDLRRHAARLVALADESDRIAATIDPTDLYRSKAHDDIDGEGS